MTRDPTLDLGQNSKTRPPAWLRRWERAQQRIDGKPFSYALDINFVLMSGIVKQRPVIAMIDYATERDEKGRKVSLQGKVGRRRFVWVQIRHIDQGDKRRGCVIALRFRRRLAEWAYRNLDLDDHVTVVGRLFHGRNQQQTNFPWIDVERATCALPVQVGVDPDYVHLRRDVYNALCEKAGKDPLQIGKPRIIEPIQRNMPAEDEEPFEDAVDSEPPPDKEPA